MLVFIQVRKNPGQCKEPMPPRKPSRPQPLHPRPQPDAAPEIVDPAWLGGAILICLVAALICSWLAVCLLVYQGEWQLVLHPSHGIDKKPASVGLTYEPIRFDAAETGQPRLTGWWIPVVAAAPAQSAPLQFTNTPKYAAYTVLYLHDGWGSLSNSLPLLELLHGAGINVFAIDYRGFGASDASVHPTEARMAEDTAAALDYLVDTRHIASQTILPYGEGLGASLAVGLARRHPELPAVILEDPDPDPTATAVAARPSKVIPIRLLFREHFEIAAPLAALATPKLLLIGGPISIADVGRRRAIQTLYRKAAMPSVEVTLTPKHLEDDYRNGLTRFLDEYLPPR